MTVILSRSPRVTPRKSCHAMVRRYLSAAFACLGLTLPATGASASDLTIFAAASLKTALDEVVATFETQTEVAGAISYAGTSVLARQIALGAPADVVLSASSDWMGWLEAEGALEPGTQVDLLGNHLVLIAHGPHEAIEANAQSLRQVIGDARVAMALVEAVPAGIYGKTALETLGLWDSMQSQIVQTDNARSALALVARGEAAFGIVYATDALAEPRVSVIARFPPSSHEKIVYPVAVVAGRASENTAQFIDYLQGDTARKIFERQGFVVLDPAS